MTKSDTDDNKSTDLKKSHKIDNGFPGAFELLMPSWQVIKLNLITIIEFIIVPVLLSLMGVILLRHSNNTQVYSLYSSTRQVTISRGVFILYGLTGITSILFAPGLTYTLLKSVRKETVDFFVAFQKGLHYFWRYFGLVICSGVIIILGFIAFIVPGVYMIRRYILAPYYLVDKDVGVFEAMRLSADDSKRFSGAIWGLLGVEFLFGLIGVIPILGWIASGVLTIMYYAAPALRYNQIKHASHKSN